MDSLDLEAKDYLPFGKSLLDFQRNAVSQMVTFLLENETHACYNACEMGLGKTIQALAAISIVNIYNYQTEQALPKILIICPAVMCATWEREIKEWLIHSPAYSITILSYGKAVNRQLELSQQHFDFLILDEAHYVKSLSAKRTKTVLRHIWPKCRFRIALSGTPFSKDALDIFSLAKRMAPHILYFTDWFRFVKTFCLVKSTPWGDKPWGVKNHDRLNKLLYENFLIRYLKTDVLTELPDKVFTRITLSNKEYGLSHIEAEFEEYKEQMRKAMSSGEDFDLSLLPKSPSFSSWKQMQGVTKAPAVIDYVQELLAQDLPVILFGYHKEALNLYRGKLSKHKPVFIDGSTSPKERDGAVLKFQSGKTNLFIGQLKAAGIGITLTRSSNVVLGELDYSPDTIAQAVDRAHRIGQKDSVTVHYFVVEDSIDERIAEMVLRKSKDFKRVLDGKNN